MALNSICKNPLMRKHQGIFFDLGSFAFAAIGADED